MPETDPWTDLADDIRRAAYTAEQAEVWQARAEKAEQRVAELEAQAKELKEDRGNLMGVLAAQTGETMRLRASCESALALLRGDRPQAALALLVEATRA